MLAAFTALTWKVIGDEDGIQVRRSDALECQICAVATASKSMAYVAGTTKGAVHVRYVVSRLIEEDDQPRII